MFLISLIWLPSTSVKSRCFCTVHGGITSWYLAFLTARWICLENKISYQSHSPCFFVPVILMGVASMFLVANQSSLFLTRMSQSSQSAHSSLIFRDCSLQARAQVQCEHAANIHREPRLHCMYCGIQTYHNGVLVDARKMPCSEHSGIFTVISFL